MRNAIINKKFITFLYFMQFIQALKGLHNLIIKWEITTVCSQKLKENAMNDNVFNLNWNYFELSEV